MSCGETTFHGPHPVEGWPKQFCSTRQRGGANDDEQFLRRAKNTRWIESSLEAALPNVSLDEGISCLLDYLLMKHGDVTREKLQDLGVLPKK